MIGEQTEKELREAMRCILRAQTILGNVYHKSSGGLQTTCEWAVDTLSSVRGQIKEDLE